jgi:UDP-glucose 4-epimerase
MRIRTLSILRCAVVKALVTGGAGYIGSVVAAQLLAAGHEVVVLDDLSRGHRAAIPAGAAHLEVSLNDAHALQQRLGDGFDAVLHFAAVSLVAESVEHPERYWHNNVGGTRNLLDAMRAHAIGRLVFSSTAATYGEPDVVPITEDQPPAPVNAYGASKLAVDLMIRDECVAHDLAAASLRYFNVAGASGPLGEDHHPETHLIPLVLQAAAGKRPAITVFGTDYDTRDGTAVRDYIHVVDLADAHLRALGQLEAGQHLICNLGTGDGFTVREVIEAARTVTGREIQDEEAGRRAGDPPQLVASNARARDRLGWTPERTLETMIADAWAWHSAHPDGY